MVFGLGLAHLPSALCSYRPSRVHLLVCTVWLSIQDVDTDAWPGGCLLGFHGSVSSNSQVHCTVKERRKRGASTHILTVFPMVMALSHSVNFY